MTDVALGVMIIVLLTVLVVLVYLVGSAKVVQPYQMGVVLAMGSYRGTIGPGLHFLPPIRRLIRVDVRPQAASLSPIPVPLPDGGQLLVGARAEYRIVDAAKAVFQTRDLPASVLALLKDAVTIAVSRTLPGTLPAKGFALSEDVRERLAEPIAKLGVEIGQVTLTLPGPLGPSEYLAGTRLR